MEELLPILAILQQELEASVEEAKEIFATLFIFVHGYASMFANNTAYLFVCCVWCMHFTFARKAQVDLGNSTFYNAWGVT